MNIDKYGKNINIKHYHDQKLTADKMASFLSNNVKTDYSAMVCDDDVLLTESISACINFLDNNLDYSAVHGKAFLMTLDKGGCNSFGRVTSLKNYPLPIIESSSPIDRVEEYFKNILNVNMSVIRAQVNANAFNEVEKLTDYYSSAIFGELVHASIVCSRGKIGRINGNYLVRQSHSGQAYHKINLIKWLSMDGWCSARHTLESTINNEVAIYGVLNIERRVSIMLSIWIESIITKTNCRTSLYNIGYIYIARSLNKFFFIKVFFKYLHWLRLKIFRLTMKGFSIKHNDIKQYVDIISNR